MPSYHGTMSDTQNYLTHLYHSDFQISKYLKEEQIIKIFDTIGIFKLKGYVREFRNIPNKSIDELITIVYFDKFLSKIFFDLSSRVETKLKSILIKECYAHTTNHFFYLKNNHHSKPDFKLDYVTLENWKIRETMTSNLNENYSHYILHYLGNHTFIDNKSSYLSKDILINIDEEKYNYPPFKYFVESASLGCIISLINSLKLGNTQIKNIVSSSFGYGKNFEKFKHYLYRLREVRNRTAHGERIFNRTFRSVTGINNFRIIRGNINQHKSMDIFLFLIYMLNDLEQINTFYDFKKYHIDGIFRTFKKDCISNKETNNLLKKLRRKEFDKITRFIYKQMTV